MTKSTGKTLQWAPTAKVLLITHHNDMEDDEIDAVWYTKSDYKSFKKDCQTSAQLAKSGNLIGSTVEALYCVRGLECMVSKQRSNLRSNRRQYARHAVLDEQYDQQKMDIQDPDLIADGYRDISRPCQIDAHQMGLRDQHAAGTAPGGLQGQNRCGVAQNSYLGISSNNKSSRGEVTNFRFRATTRAIRT